MTKGERAGRLDRAKECRHTMPTGNSNGKRVKRGTLEVAANYSTMILMKEKMG